MQPDWKEIAMVAALFILFLVQCVLTYLQIVEIWSRVG